MNSSVLSKNWDGDGKLKERVAYFRERNYMASLLFFHFKKPISDSLKSMQFILK